MRIKNKGVSTLLILVLIWALVMIGFIPEFFLKGVLAKDEYTSDQFNGDWAKKSENRGFRVHVYGEVFQPGIYFMDNSDRLSSVLMKAGGTTPTGSERRIELRRNNKKTEKYDFLKLKRFGDLTNNPFIQNNDVVVVSIKERVVVVQGPVHKPGEYELLEGEKLENLIYELAEGFTNGYTSVNPIRVIRYKINGERVIITVKKKGERSFDELSLVDGDIVDIPHKFNIEKNFNFTASHLPNDNIAYPSYVNSVYVLGGVKLPKEVQYDPRHTIANYIVLAGGLSRLARDDVEIFNIGSQKQVETKRNSLYQVNPGDTIIIGENLLGPEFWITFMVSVASLGVTSYALLK